LHRAIDQSVLDRQLSWRSETAGETIDSTLTSRGIERRTIYATQPRIYYDLLRSGEHLSSVRSRLLNARIELNSLTQSDDRCDKKLEMLPEENKAWRFVGARDFLPLFFFFFFFFVYLFLFTFCLLLFFLVYFFVYFFH